MTPLESLHDIKLTGLYLQSSLLRSDIEKIRIAEVALDQLVDRFYAENEDYL